MADASAEDLASLARIQFETLGDLDGSDELLAEYDHHVFAFTTHEDEGIVIDIRDGDLSIQPAAQWDPDSLHRNPTVIQADEAVLRDIFAGDETIVDGVWGGTVRAPVYGAQMGYTSWISRILKAVRTEQVD